MTNRISAVALALALAASVKAQTLGVPDRPTEKHGAKVEVSFDRFTNTTSAMLRPMRIGGLLSGFEIGAVMVSLGGQPLSSTPRALVMIRSTNDEWQYLRCHGLSILADGQSLGVIPTEHAGDVEAGIRRARVIERVSASLSLDQLVQLATARTVEGRLCNTEFALNPKQILAFRDFASRLKD